MEYTTLGQNFSTISKISLLRNIMTIGTKFCLTAILLLNNYMWCSAQESIQVDNTSPRMDSSNNIVDAHDGRIVQFEDKYYWYGTSYGTTNGFTTANHYVCYSSSDMKNWEKEGKLLPDQPEGVYYRPHIIYNKKTEKYVLWFNWYPQLWDGQFGVATSKNPEGPFKIINDNVKMVRSDVGLGDFGLFVDDDETAYISYNTIQDHQVSIEKLGDDYLSSTMENGGIIAEHMEAGSQFKRDGKYYLLTDHTCCFCNYGSGARVYISEDPMDGYQLTNNINRYPGSRALVVKDGIKTGTQYETLNKTENVFNALEMVSKNEIQLDNIEIHVFTGNRPENCGDVDNPRVHPKIGIPEFDLFYWDYGQWEKIETIRVDLEKGALKTKIGLGLSPLRTRKIKIVPKNDYVFDAVNVNEIELSHDNEPVTPKEFDWYVTGADVPQRPIVPAQQTYVMQLEAKDGPKYIWMGDLWGSASDNIKGHDYQYWSAPLEFNEDGTVQRLQWTDKWEVPLK